MFSDFDMKGFWKDSAYARKEYVDDPLTDEKVKRTEEKLGYKLPASYVAFMKHQNGGMPRRNRHGVSEPTSWAPDHVAVHAIYSIGGAKPGSLVGEFATDFWVREWGYPPIGVYFADCPSAGHDMFCLDYRACGPTGEPSVVHVDQGRDYKITLVAKDFESFVRGLQTEEAFPID